MDARPLGSIKGPELDGASAGAMDYGETAGRCAVGRRHSTLVILTIGQPETPGKGPELGDPAHLEHLVPFSQAGKLLGSRRNNLPEVIHIQMHNAYDFRKRALEFHPRNILS